MARGAVKETGVNAITGSFSRILAIGSGSGGGKCVFANITWGLERKEGANLHYSNATDLTLSSSAYIEGPIVNFKLTSGGGLAEVSD